jgi:hypothetical protein
MNDKTMCSPRAVDSMFLERGLLLALFGLVAAGCEPIHQTNSVSDVAPDPAPVAERVVEVERPAEVQSKAPEIASVDGPPSLPWPFPTEPTPLAVEGWRAASHVGPDVAEAWPQPVTIVLHGNFDRPEWECEVSPN